MKSPVTGKEMALIREARELTFRKELFEVVYHYYLCEDSGEKFTSTATDEVNLNQLYNQYRDKHNIPFPDEIREIRSRYGLSASKMSEILGFGINGYRNYENGEVPSKSNGNLIQLVRDPHKFKDLIAISEVLDDAAKSKLIKKINAIHGNKQGGVSPFEVEFYLMDRKLPDQFTGYRKPNLAKLTEMVVFFSEQLNPWKTQMNKLLFYADFLMFKRSGFSISGTRYRAINMGPVPNNYHSIYEYIENEGHIDIRLHEFGGEEFGIRSGRAFNNHLFDQAELHVLNTIVAKFRTIGTKKVKAVKIIDMSHEEAAWIMNESSKGIISYKYAFDLKHA